MVEKQFWKATVELNYSLISKVSKKTINYVAYTVWKQMSLLVTTNRKSFCSAVAYCDFRECT